MKQLTLGQKIAARRKLLGMSQENLAESLGISRQAISKWEADACVPEIDKLIALSKLYSVSIGWLLGIEDETTSHGGFSEEQLYTVEELLKKYQKPKQTTWWKYLTGAFALIAIMVAFLYSGHQIKSLNAYNIQAAGKIDMLSKGNSELQARLDSISEDNELLKIQLDSVNQLLNLQEESDRLLTDFFRIEAHADENLETVTTTLYMRPKQYLPQNKALLSIQNPITGFSSTVICNWSDANQVYIARYVIPAEDGYKVSFILYGADGYQEENLLMRDPGFAYTGRYCSFYADQPPVLLDMPIHIDGQAPVIDFEFNSPIYSPHIFAKTAVAYKDIRIILEYNDRIIWEQSYLDEFHLAAGGVYLNVGDTPVEPNIKVPLHNVQIGDELELYLIAETANGGAVTQNYYTLLKRIQFRNINELDHLG